MLRLRIVCVGKCRDRFYREAVEEYFKRLGAFCQIDLIEVAEERLSDRPSAAEIEKALEQETARIRKQLLPDSGLVCLCIEGEEKDSPGLTEILTKAEASGRPRMNFVIGGSFGLSEGLKREADLRLSMSRMTFPHTLARVMLCEQLYRGFQIKEGSRYHK